MKIFFKYTIILLSLLCCCACTNTQKQKVLKYSTWGSQSEMNTIKPLLEEFEKQNNVKIEILHIPQNYFQKLHLLFASKQPPDVLFINNYYLPLYQKNNLLEDLTPYFESEIRNKIYFQNAIDSLSVDGKVFAIPRDISNMVVYYNKDLLNKQNISISKDWNYNQFLDICKKLSTKENWGCSFEEHPIFWEQILWANSSELFKNNGNFNLNDPKTKEALSYYISLRTLHHAAPQKTDSANRTMTQMFLDKKIAILVSGRWIVPKLRQEAHFDWDIINTPKGNYGSIAASDSSGWAISKQSTQKQTAVKLIKFLSSKEAINKITKDGLITPALKESAYSSSFLDNQKPKNAITFLEINKNAKVKKIPQDYNQKIEKLLNELEPYFTGKEKISPTTKFEL